jgi:dTDP-4-dehydrorhamnose 3,5-epimerase
MVFNAMSLAGAYLIEPERIEDERGFFARTWCREEFERHGLNPRVVQCNVSYNVRRGTLRGMHYQVKPHEEAKLIRCTRGAIYDVIVDLRPDSATYRRWVSAELTADNRRMLYIPEGFAHGFQTLADETELFYQMGEHFYPQSSRGVRYDDPVLGITWPLEVTVISEKDRGYPLLRASEASR